MKKELLNLYSLLTACELRLDQLKRKGIIINQLVPVHSKYPSEDSNS